MPLNFKPTIKPHGNAKASNDRPFHPTWPSTREKLKSAATKKPRAAIEEVDKNVGGLFQVGGPGVMPRNAMQISNIRKLMKLEERGDDELYSIMLQCKQETIQGEQFIRDVKACPEPALILATGTQLDNLVHFSTNSNNFSILTIDPTFNLGAFDVTPVAYRHLILLNPKTGKPPVFLGPLLIHYRKTFSTYLYFAFTLIGLKPKLACLRAFGTDGEKALHDAFNYCYPNAVHLLCAIHSRRNIKDELARRGYEGKTVKIFLQEIFGHRLDSVYCEGLIDSEDSATFDRNLASLKSVWKEREESCTGVTTSFYDWFINNKAAGMKASMLPSVRRAAHLDHAIYAIHYKCKRNPQLYVEDETQLH